MSQNYFQHFGLDQRYDIDLKALAKAYRDKQQIAHPDRHSHKAVADQRQAVQETAFNTERYHTLKSDVQRAIYLLGLNGHEFDLANYTFSDIDMLMQQMKYREYLSDIKDNMDDEGLDSLMRDVETKVAELKQQLGTLFESQIELSLEEIKSSICELQFYEKLGVECDHVEEHLLAE